MTLRAVGLTVVLGFFFFLNLNLYSARVQLGTGAVTCVTTYYAYEGLVRSGGQRQLAMGSELSQSGGGRV